MTNKSNKGQEKKAKKSNNQTHEEIETDEVF